MWANLTRVHLKKHIYNNSLLATFIDKETGSKLEVI